MLEDNRLQIVALIGDKLWSEFAIAFASIVFNTSRFAVVFIIISQANSIRGIMSYKPIKK